MILNKGRRLKFIKALPSKGNVCRQSGNIGHTGIKKIDRTTHVLFKCGGSGLHSNKDYWTTHYATLTVLVNLLVNRNYNNCNVHAQVYIQEASVGGPGLINITLCFNVHIINTSACKATVTMM